MKNFIVLAFLVIVVAAGIYFTVISDPELEPKRAFDQAISEFAKNAELLEQHFKKNASLPPSTKTLYLTSGEQSGLTAKMQVFAQYVILTFSSGEWAVANQTIVLEPLIKDQQLRWKCINGSLLVRWRSKDCRLGNGILISEL